MRLGLAVIAIVAGFVLFLKLFEKRMIYFPAADVGWSPGDSGMVFEDLRLTCPDGVAIHGWFIPVVSARATVLFFHGNAGNISHRVEKIQILRDLHVDVCIIDYHGYGQSGG